MDRARSQTSNARVFVRDFQQAVTIDFGECEGALDLGVVRDEIARAIHLIDKVANSAD